MRQALLFLCVAVSICSGISSHKRFATETLKDLEVLYSNDVKITSPASLDFAKSRKRSVEEDSPETLSVAFSAFDKEFDFQLAKNYDIFTDTAKVTYEDGEGRELESFSPKILSYKGTGDSDLQVRLTIVGRSENNLVLKGFFSDGEELYFVDPVAEHVSLEKRSALPGDALMVVYKDDALVEKDNTYCGGINPETMKTELHSLPTTKSLWKRQSFTAARTLPAGNCPTSPKTLVMSVVGDWNYNNKITALGQQVDAYIQTQWNSIAAIYQRTVNVIPTLDEIIVRTAASSDAWNANPCGTIDNKLTAFGRFRGTRNANAGLWHLMTGCYTSGTVGLAWIGVLCTKTVSASQAASGTGVSSHLSGAGSYRVAAHEMGHNFGSEHTNGGVMIASNINSDTFHIDSQTQMCNEIYSSGSCLTSSGSCTRNCAGKTCGSDGCGGSCGTCSGSQTCSTAGTCQACTPNCNGKQCGADGCGGQCGTCSGTTTCSSTGQCVATGSSDQDTFLRVHNAARAAKGVAPLTWGATEASTAATYAAQCVWGHNSGRGSLGENIAAGSGTSYTAERAVTMWVDEEKSWNCATNQCSGTCGHYTQVVWASTLRLGCAKQVCNTGSPFGSGSWTYVVCNYGPPGNYVGQRPFPAAQCGGGCTPSSTCEARVCGSINNGCETVSCGTCSSGSTCNSQGQCECSPTASCSAQRRVCGTIWTGCSNQTCGTCPSGQTCNAQGQCETNPTPCVPTTSCRAQGKTCGTVETGCGTESCGSCISPMTCISGTCSNCSNCHQFASCQNNRCVCQSGYTGDGVTCTPVGNVPPAGTASWTVLDGTTTGWRSAGGAGSRLTGDELEQTENSAGPNALQWVSSQTLFDATSTTYLADVMRTNSRSEVGLVFGITTSGTYWTVTFNSAAIYLTSWTTRSYRKYILAEGLSFPINTWIETKVVISDGNKLRATVGTRSYSVSLTGGTWAGAVGLVTLGGSGKFQDAEIQTASKVTLALTSCDTADGFLNRLAAALGVPPERFTGVEGSSPCGNKRQGEFSSFTFTVEGSSVESSQAVSSKLSSLQSSNHISLSGNGVGASSVTPVPSGAEAGTPVEALPVEAVVGIAAAGLSAIVIAAIVVGSVVVAGAATAGTVVAVKKLRAPKPEPAEIPMEQEAPRKPKKGVDIYNFDPENITSITARGVPQPKP